MQIVAICLRWCEFTFYLYILHWGNISQCIINAVISQSECKKRIFDKHAVTRRYRTLNTHTQNIFWHTFNMDEGKVFAQRLTESFK